jgi:hypothetical protein
MPLTPLQSKVLRLLASHRTTQSYVAGGAALNRNHPRLSDDIDIFSDRGIDLAATAQRDVDALLAAGLSVERIANHYGAIIDAVVTDGKSQTMIQWQDETRARFFAVVSQPEFGMRLSDADLAVNKVLAAAGRRQARDMIDLVTLADTYASLGALVWAAGAKSPLGPGQMIEAIRRNANSLTADEIATVRTTATPPQRSDILGRLNTHLDRALKYVEIAPLQTREHLIVSANNAPIEADDKMLSNGLARALPLVEFGHVVPVAEKL